MSESEGKAENSYNFDLTCLKLSMEQEGHSPHSMINVDHKAQHYINKRFGYSLLDLQGRFLFVDDNSQKFFEMKAEELYNKE